MSATPTLAREDFGILESPEAVLSTLDRDGKRKWIYPTPSKGRFYGRRLIVAWFLIVLFIALPIIRINGKPALLLDFMHREFAVFGLVFYPTDTLLLMLFMIGTLLSVFLFTALLGRVWCGWACPQTVYMEFVFRPIERWIEGKEHVRKRRDEGPWTFDRIWRWTAKLSIYLAISLVLAHTFVAYFVGWDQLLVWMGGTPTQHWGFFMMMSLTTGLMLFNFGYFREQMCTITCPYARFQSVLLDPDSLIVSYDPNRGEPRGKRSKRQDRAGLGDCIDCMACVRTCPTGIDIRDGLQMECIACTQCVDACDEIMDKMGYPRGLIRYTSENELAGKKTRLVRPRTVVYVVLLTVITATLTGFLLNRSDYDVNVGRIVGEPFITLPDGSIANRVRFRVRNQQDATVRFTIEAVEPAGVKVNVVGLPVTELKPHEMKRVETFVVIPAVDWGNRNSLNARFRLSFTDGTVVEEPFTLLGPTK